jgi:hypothetical protein
MFKILVAGYCNNRNNCYLVILGKADKDEFVCCLPPVMLLRMLGRVVHGERESMWMEAVLGLSQCCVDLWPQELRGKQCNVRLDSQLLLLQQTHWRNNGKHKCRYMHVSLITFSYCYHLWWIHYRFKGNINSEFCKFGTIFLQHKNMLCDCHIVQLRGTVG